MLSQSSGRTPLHISLGYQFLPTVREEQNTHFKLKKKKKKRGKLGGQLTCLSAEPLSHSSPASLHIARALLKEACTWSVALREDAGTHMAGFLPASCPLSSPPAAAPGLLHMPHSCFAGTFLSLLCWISRSPHLLPQTPKEFHFFTAIWVFPNDAAPWLPSGCSVLSQMVQLGLVPWVQPL